IDGPKPFSRFFFQNKPFPKSRSPKDRIKITGEESRDTPYEVNNTIPVEGYESIDFILIRMCGSDGNNGYGQHVATYLCLIVLEFYSKGTKIS
ncbi:hypothetical protein C5167_015192, partial [Papaver somniferum]